MFQGAERLSSLCRNGKIRKEKGDKEKEMKDRGPATEGELHVLINHCIERLPILKEGFVCDCMDELPMAISFESPQFVLTMRLERKMEAKKGNESKTG